VIRGVSISVRINKLSPLAAAVAAAALSLAGAGTASAAVAGNPKSSNECVNESFGLCGTLSFPLEGAGDRVMAATTLKSNAPLTIQDQSDSSTQDFYELNENGISGDEVFFIGTPLHPTGFCVAAVSPQSAYSLLTVRPCNAGDNYQYQTFVPQSLPDGDHAWSPITDQFNVIQDANDGGAGTAMNIGPFNNSDRQDTVWQEKI
jgi:hypothetical protein